MTGSTKTQRLREKALADLKQSKQATFDSFPSMPSMISPTENRTKKQIIISEICNSVKEDELDIQVTFKLLPSSVAFSRIMAELYFEKQKMYCSPIKIPQGQLFSEELALNPVIDMRGMKAGTYLIRIDLSELWSSGEILTTASKEMTVQYTPIRREDRLVKIPILKRVTGPNLEVVSKDEKNIYREIEEDLKKEQESKRDEW